MSDSPGSKGSASPGPWSWGAGRGKWVLVDANNKPMLSFSEWSIEQGDMPLIAAAPQMAAMLRELADSAIPSTAGFFPSVDFYDRLHALLKELP